MLRTTPALRWLAPRPAAPRACVRDHLTAELLTLLGEGLSPQQAVDEMQLSWHTIRTHSRNLYRKLGVTDRAAAVAIAWREGLVR